MQSRPRGRRRWRFVTIAPAPLFSRYGIAASTSRTVPIMSVENSFCQLSSSCPDGERADIGDDGIDATELRCHIAHPCLERGTVGHINRTAEGRNPLGLQRRDRAVHVRLISRANSDIGAFGREGFGNRLPIPLVLPVTRTLAPLSSKSIFRLPPWSFNFNRCPHTRPVRGRQAASQKKLRTDIVRVDVLTGQRTRDPALLHDVASLR